MWSLVKSVGTRLTSFAVFALLARQLSPQDFGLAATVGLLATALCLLVEGGFSDTLIQRRTVAEDDLLAVFWYSLLLSLLFSACVPLAAQAIGDWLDTPDLPPVLTSISISIPFFALTIVPTALLRRNLRYKPLAIRAFLAGLIGGVVAVIGALMGLGVWALVIQGVTMYVLGALILWIYSPITIKFRFPVTHLVSLWGTALPLNAMAIIEFIGNRLIELAIAKTYGAEVLGLYIVAVKVPQVLMQVVNATISEVSISSLSRVSGNLGELRRAYLDGISAVLLVSVPMYILCAILAKETISFCFGARWSEMYVVMALLCVASALQSLDAISISTIVSLNKGREAFCLTFLRAVLTIVAFFCLFNHGLVWVIAASVCIGLFISMIYCLRSCRFMELRIGELLKAVRMPLVSVLLMASVSYLSRDTISTHAPSAVLALAATAAVGIAVFISSELLIDRARLVFVLRILFNRSSAV